MNDATKDDRTECVRMAPRQFLIRGCFAFCRGAVRWKECNRLKIMGV